jgi:ubiquinone/menaquinone biosynthesis C-methylase UbiE
MDYKDYEIGKSGDDFWFRAKKQLIKNLLLRELESGKKLKILNIGAGTGEDLEILNKFGEVYVIDIEKKALDLIPKKLCKEKNICDACNLNYPDNFFDLVVAFDVFEHIEKHEKAIKEAHRVLKRKGNLIFSVPAFQFLYSAHDKALKHKRRYSKRKLKDLLRCFKKINLSYWNSLLFLPIALQRIAKKRTPPKVEAPKFNIFLDNLLFKILNFENFLIKRNFKFPLGITIIGCCNKI